MVYFYSFMLVLVTSLTGYVSFYYLSFVKGNIYSTSKHKQIPMKLVLSASLKIFIALSSLMIFVPVAFIIITMLLKIKIEWLWWWNLFFSVFNGLYFIGYLYPKVRRIIHWDLKNPTEKWDELYRNFNLASQNFFYLTATNFLLALSAYLIYIYKNF